MQVSVVVPAFNEENTLIPGLKSLFETFDFLQVSYEIVVVIDGCAKTRNSINNFSDPRLKIITYAENHGKGYALIQGFKNTSGNVVVFWDAGTQISQESLKLAWRTFSFSEADVVVGSKRHPLSKVEYPLKRRFYSLFCQLAAFVVFGLNIKDTQTGLKIFRREILEKIVPRIRTSGYAVDIEMLVATRSLGYKKIIETPVDLSHFKFGGGVNYRAIYQVALDMLRTYFRLITGYYKESVRTNLFLTIDVEKDPWENLIPEKEIYSILEQLKNSKQQITFFVCGEIYEEKPELIKAIISGGHEVGLHSFSHKRIKTIENLEIELRKSEQFIKDIKPRGFRAPFADLPEGGLEVLKKFGFSYDSSSYYSKRYLNEVIAEFPVAAVRIIPTGNNKFRLPLNFSNTLLKGLFPLGCGLTTALMPKIQRNLIEKFNNCVIFLHPWQFSKYSFFKTLFRRPGLLIYRRNCSRDFEIMLNLYVLKKMEELIRA